MPAEQVCVLLHAVLQPPQWSWLVCVSKHCVPHAVFDPPQHVPFMLDSTPVQTSPVPPFAGLHAPQLLLSVVVLTHTPPQFV